MASTHSNKASHTAFLSENVSSSICHSQLGHPVSVVLHRLLFSFQLSIVGNAKFTLVCSECQLGKSEKLFFSISTFASS